MSILSYNVAGISGHDKRSKILNKFIYPVHGKNPDVICFQELKCNIQTGNELINGLPSYRNLLSLDPGQASRKLPPKAGVSISFHKSLNVTYLDGKVEPGWLLLVKCRIQEKVFVIGNVYITSGLPAETYREKLEIIDKHLKSLKCENVILMGDFNSPLSAQDCFKGWEHSRQLKCRAAVLNSFLERWEIQDSWRIHNPHARDFTHRTAHKGDSRRIDFVFVSLNVACFVSDCSIGYVFCSDHAPVHTDFFFGEPSGKRQFLFPVDLCYSEQFRLQLKENLDVIKKENSQANPHTRWELIKATVRSTALKFKTFQSKLRKEIVEEYEAKIAKVVHRLDSEESPLLRKGSFEEIAQLQTSLDSMFKEGRALKYAANLARWYGEKNKDSKYFLSKFKQDKSKPIISQLITHAGTIMQNSAILKQAHEFYQKLYSQDQVILPSDGIDQSPTLSPNDQRIMAEDISMYELFLALKAMRPSSAPGSDGITVKFYLHFWDLISDDLFKSFQHSLLVGKLSISQRQGLIRLLPKKLRNLLFISNWRPITLLNVDYKILTKLFAKKTQRYSSPIDRS